MPGSTSLSNQLRARWPRETRLNQIAGYIQTRLDAIDSRFIETFRYVEPSPDNGGTFSYEYSSILRDCGSVFDSTMRELLRLANYQPPRQPGYDIRDFREFLRQSVNRQGLSSGGGIATVVLTINSSWARRYVMPFKGLENGGSSLEWWDAYNEVKHSDLEQIARGNLSNALNALGAVAILNALVGATGGWTRTFRQPMFYDPMDDILAGLF